MKSKLFKNTLLFTILILLAAAISSPEKASAATSSKITLNKKSTTICKGKTLQLTAKSVSDVKWSSSDKKVATVSSNGKVKALKAGTTLIKAASKSNKKIYATCQVKVVIDDSENVKVLCNFFYPYDKVSNQTISSYKQLKTLMAKLEENPSDNYYILRKLKLYDESYFKNNVLYLRNYMNGYPQSIFAIRKTRSLMADGKYKLNITLTDYNYGHVAYPAHAQSYLVFIETSKPYAKSIGKIQIKYEHVKSFMPLPPR